MKDISSTEDFKIWIDGYDTGINYVDFYIGKIFDMLKKNKVYNNTIIMISSDHGENQGELNIYGDHQTADYCTSRVPFILKYPRTINHGVDNGLHYQSDIAATILELCDCKVPELWDGESFAKSINEKSEYSRDYVVVSQNAWSCQRSVIFKNWILIRTYHAGLKDFPEYMLFDLTRDPHETMNQAEEKKEIVQEGMKLLGAWHEKMAVTSKNQTDPMQETLKEGGPFHTRIRFHEYCQRLRSTGRAHYADILEKKEGN